MPYTFARKTIHFIFHSCSFFSFQILPFTLFYPKEKMEATCQGTKKLMGRMCSWRNNFKCPHMVYFFLVIFCPYKQQWSWDVNQRKKWYSTSITQCLYHIFDLERQKKIDVLMGPFRGNFQYQISVFWPTLKVVKKGSLKHFLTFPACF